MSDADNLYFNFELDTEDTLDANFELAESANYDALFEIYASGTTWGNILGYIDNQPDLINILNEKADISYVDSVTGALSDSISGIESIIGGYGDIVSYNASYFATSIQGGLADTALQPNDNISELSNDVGYITSASLPTVNDATITIQKNGTTVDSFTLNQSSNDTINITVPTQTSELTNNSGFITNTVNNLINYYLKSETYTKLEVQQLIASIPQFRVRVVQSLPETGERMVLYLVPKDGEAPDVYNEYIWVEEEEEFELLGSTSVDLSDYVTTSDLTTALADYVTNTALSTTLASYVTSSSLTTTLADYALSSSLATVATSGSYNDLSNKPTIPTVNDGTLTIQTNGTTVATFTANQSGNTTASIVVPTDTSDLTNGANFVNSTQLQNALDSKQDLLTSDNAGTDISIASGAETLTVTGNGSVTLEDAVDLNSVTLSGDTQSIALPVGYTPVENVENSVTGAKLNTEIVADTTSFEMEVRVKPSTGSWYIFQSRGSSEGITGIGGSTSGSTITGNYLNTSVASSITRNTSHIYYVKLTCNNGNMTLYVKDETTGDEDTQTSTYSTSTPTENLYLWGNSQNNLVAHNYIYMARMKKNGVTVLDYIPCIYNDTVGFYDTVSRSFKTKTSASGTLAAGDVLQTPSPTPDKPNYLLCNNGQISCSRNMFRTTGTSTTTGGTKYEVQPDGSVVCSGTATAYASWQFGRAYVTPNMGTVTLIVDGVYGATGNITVDRCQLCNSSGTVLATGSWSTWTKSLSFDLSQYPTVSYINVTLKRSSSGAVNATVKAQVMKGTSTTTTWKPFGQVSINTNLVETVTDESGNTATAENLFGVGDNADTQELLSGVVTRKYAVMAFTGNESWVGSSSLKYYLLALANVTPAFTRADCVCTHFISSQPMFSSNAGYIWCGTDYINLNYDNVGGISSSTNMANFKNWLREQYANGTPVIIVYPLATETTETVTEQTLTAIEGNNTLTITQASIDNLPISADYETLGVTTISFTGTIPTKTSQLTNDSGYITGITSSDVTTALGYAPYDSTNPNGYTSNVGTVTSVNNVLPVSGNVTLSIPTATSDLTNDSGYITGITSTDVTTALGYTPYNSSNPNGYITSSALSNYVTTTALSTTLADYVLSSSLATVATTGAYSDLTGIPTIPSALSDITVSAGSNITINGDTISATDTTYSAFTGCDSITAGASGLVPAPSAGDENKYLKADGTWNTITVDQTYNSSSSNPQSGVAIAGAGFLTSHQSLANYVDLTSDQSITGLKSFGGIHTNSIGTNTSPSLSFMAYDSANSMYRVGNNSLSLNLIGRFTRPYYGTSSSNFTALALMTDIPTATSDLTNDSGYITGITSSNVTTALGYTPVNKSGDTMTGGLTVQNDYIVVQSTDSWSSTPSTQLEEGVNFYNSNGDRLGYVNCVYTTDGSRLARLNTRNADGSANTYIQVGYNPSGNAYCTFPDTTCVDGQWTSVSRQIASDVSVNGSTNLTYTLSDVPNDGNKYEVLLAGQVYTSSSSSNQARINVSSDIVSGVCICAAITRTSQSNIAMGSAVIPVGNRQITVSRDTNWNGTINIWVKGYRRIGSNS